MSRSFTWRPAPPLPAYDHPGVAYHIGARFEVDVTSPLTVRQGDASYDELVNLATAGDEDADELLAVVRLHGGVIIDAHR